MVKCKDIFFLRGNFNIFGIMIWEPEGLKPVRKFLTDNGFEAVEGEKDIYKNDKCIVRIMNDHYMVESDGWPDIKEYGFICSRDLSIYWLIGVLTWYELIEKDYVGGV